MKARVLAVVGILLIAAGVAGLVYGGFTYTQDTHDVDLGVAEITFADKERFTIPVWAGVAAVAVGTLLVLVGRWRR
jgi:hypothetical protein